MSGPVEKQAERVQVGGDLSTKPGNLDTSPVDYVVWLDEYKQYPNGAVITPRGCERLVSLAAALLALREAVNGCGARVPQYECEPLACGDSYFDLCPTCQRRASDAISILTAIPGGQE